MLPLVLALVPSSPPPLAELHLAFEASSKQVVALNVTDHPFVLSVRDDRSDTGPVFLFLPPEGMRAFTLPEGLSTRSLAVDLLAEDGSGFLRLPLAPPSGAVRTTLVGIEPESGLTTMRIRDRAAGGGGSAVSVGPPPRSPAPAGAVDVFVFPPPVYAPPPMLQPADPIHSPF